MATQRPEGMGIGVLGNSDLVFKRKFRWTFKVLPYDANQPIIDEHFCKIASRPNLTVEETELNFLNDKTWIPGKPSWETMEITYIDVASASAKMSNLWTWLASVYNFLPSTNLGNTGVPTFVGAPKSFMGSQRKDYIRKGVLKLYDGCGTELETWTLGDMWPTTINFGDLDYTSSDTCDITLTVRYSRVVYQSGCPSISPAPLCSACTG